MLAPVEWKMENAILQKYLQMQNANSVLCHVVNSNLFFILAKSLILCNLTHTKPIRGLDLSPIQTSLLSSGGINGEVSTNRTKSAGGKTLIVRAAANKMGVFLTVPKLWTRW
jgi:hypothetical protein